MYLFRTVIYLQEHGYFSDSHAKVSFHLTLHITSMAMYFCATCLDSFYSQWR